MASHSKRKSSEQTPLGSLEPVPEDSSSVPCKPFTSRLPISRSQSGGDSGSGGGPGKSLENLFLKSSPEDIQLSTLSTPSMVPGPSLTVIERPSIEVEAEIEDSVTTWHAGSSKNKLLASFASTGPESTLKKAKTFDEPSPIAHGLTESTHGEDFPPTPPNKPTVRIRRTCAQAFIHFFTDNSVTLSSLRLILLAILIAIPGLLIKLLFPYSIASVNDESYDPLYICLAISMFILGYVFTNASVYGILNLSNHITSLRRVSWFYYLGEVRTYVSFSLWILVCFGLWAWVGDKFFHGSSSFINPVFVVLLVATVLLAINKHFISYLAMSFNFVNYLDRIEDCLFAEKVLVNLEKSKHTYKHRRWLAARQKQLETSGTFGRSRFLRAIRKRTTGIHPTAATTDDIDNMVDMIGGSDNDLTIPPRTILSSNIQRPLSAILPTVSPTSTANSLSPQQTSSFVVNDNAGVQGIAVQNQGVSRTASLTTFDKHRIFQDFYCLANKTITQFGYILGDHQIEIARESQLVAARLFKWLKSSQRPYLIPSDIQPYFDDPEEFSRAVELVRSRQAPDAILESDLQAAIERTYNERFGLSKSLQNMATAVQKIDAIFKVLIFVALAAFSAVVFGTDLKGVFSLSSLIFGSGYVIQSSARNAIESMIFLFILHPYDVGDRVYVQISDSNYENLVISELNLLSTTFERWDGVRVYVPNHVLAMKPIINIRRSGGISEKHVLQIGFSTTSNQLNEFKCRLSNFLLANQTDFLDTLMVNIDYVENLNRLILSVVIQHRNNWQDFEAHLARKSKVILFIKDSLTELQVQYFPPVQKISIIGDESIRRLLSPN